VMPDGRPCRSGERPYAGENESANPGWLLHELSITLMWLNLNMTK
jgi:hypothetical protein